jgi:type I restriction-modification system DNA methylase subunit
MLRLAVELLQPPQGAVIYDPACGCGNFLLTALADAENRHPGSQPMLLGQDTRINELGMARMQLLAKDTPHHLLLADPLALPLTFPPASPQAPGRATTLAKADIVLAVVPERVHAWDNVSGGMEKLGRFPAGAPRNSRLAFFWQALACATPGSGKMAVFVPPDIFKHRDGDDLCGYLIHHRLLVAVIDLPESVRAGFAKPPVLLIIDRAAANRTRVAFISDRVRGAARIDLDGGHYDADRIAAAFTAYQAERQPHPSLVTVPYSVMAVHHHSLLLETYIEAVP